MYTDIVGYSKLTGDNQELALEILAEHNKVLFQCTKHYSGEIIKKTGDGVCALFENSSDSIKCAIDIQKDLFKRNKWASLLGYWDGIFFYILYFGIFIR